MNSALLLLMVLYAVLAFLVLALCLFTRWSVWVKTLSILVVTGFCLLSYDVLLGLLGYPAKQDLPARFVFHSAVVIAPDKNKQDSGRVYLWLSEITPDGPTRLPRAYEIPFDKELGNQVQEGLRRSKEGLVQIGETLENEKRNSAGVLGGIVTKANSQRFRLKDLPEPALPEK
jgi:hypothetical protein